MDADGRDEPDLSQIRVLRVITRLNVGGPAIQAAILTARLDPARFESRLVAGREGPAEGSMLDLREGLRVPVVRVPSLGREIGPLDDVRALLHVIRIARDHRPHIVHTHLAKAGFVGRIAGRIAGARAIVHTYHGSVFRGYFGRRQAGVYLAIERALSRITDRIVAITPLQRQELIDLRIAPAAKIVEIPLGLDLTRFAQAPDRATARRTLGIAENGPLVALVGRLVPIKDVPTFLRALALLVARVPAARAVVVGDGTERARLIAQARELGIANRCSFLGWRADIENVYGAADVVALSSLNEGSPVSVIEAMASGRPVVATSVGGVPDVVRHEVTGLLVPPSDPSLLADAVERLLTDEATRARMGESARRAALDRFTAERLVRDIEELYAMLIDSPMRP